MADNDTTTDDKGTTDASTTSNTPAQTSTPPQSQTTTTPAQTSTPSQPQTPTPSTTAPAATTTTNAAPAAITGYIYDDTAKTLTVDRDVFFRYQLPVTLTTNSYVIGYMPEGIYVDVSTSQILGKPKLQTGTVLTITTPGSDPYILTLNVNAPLELQFDGWHPTYMPNGSFYSGLPMPAYRNLGDSPAVSVKAFGGTGNYTYAFSGDAHGLSIDAKTGLISGTLPTTAGEVPVSVSVSDGVASVTISSSFFVSERIPVDTNVLKVDRKWYDDLDIRWTNLITAIAGLRPEYTVTDVYLQKYMEIMSPLRYFVTAPEADAVPAVKKWAETAQAYLATADDRIKAGYTTKDQQFMAALLQMFNGATADSGLSVYLIRALAGNVDAVRDAIKAAK